VLTPTGFRDLFVLVFLHVGTRRVFLSPATYHPNEAWVRQQAAAFVEHARRHKLGAEILMHDRDTKFTAGFDGVLKQAGLRPMKASFRAPNTVAFVERVVQTIKQECLDYFVVFGQRHMNYLCGQFVEHYHAERPHQGLANELPTPPRRRRAREPDVVPLAEIGCRARLGGLLKHYYRRAA